MSCPLFHGFWDLIFSSRNPQNKRCFTPDSNSSELQSLNLLDTWNLVVPDCLWMLEYSPSREQSSKLSAPLECANGPFQHTCTSEEKLAGFRLYRCLEPSWLITDPTVSAVASRCDFVKEQIARCSMSPYGSQTRCGKVFYVKCLV